MLSILLGPDDFSKKEYIASLAKKKSAELEFFVSADDLPDPRTLLEQNLFSKAKFFVLNENSDSGIAEELLPGLIKSANHIFITKPKLDKRTALGKALSSNKDIENKSFPLPHGKELDKWLTERARTLGGSILPSAADVLAQRLGRDNVVETKVAGKVIDVTEVYNLWQAEGELRKLLAYADGKVIEPEDIQALVPAYEGVDVFEITNALGEGQSARAMQLLNIFLEGETSSDEKGKIIQLNALLSEQFRNILMVQDFIKQRASEDEILSQTGWKSGRLFVMKKIASHFTSPKVIETLNKLEALDEELKTGSAPPRVILDMIVAQLV